MVRLSQGTRYRGRHGTCLSIRTFLLVGGLFPSITGNRCTDNHRTIRHCPLQSTGREEEVSSSGLCVRRGRNHQELTWLVHKAGSSRRFRFTNALLANRSLSLPSGFFFRLLLPDRSSRVRENAVSPAPKGSPGDSRYCAKRVDHKLSIWRKLVQAFPKRPTLTLDKPNLTVEGRALPVCGERTRRTCTTDKKNWHFFFFCQAPRSSGTHSPYLFWAVGVTIRRELLLCFRIRSAEGAHTSRTRHSSFGHTTTTTAASQLACKRKLMISLRKSDRKFEVAPEKTMRSWRISLCALCSFSEGDELGFLWVTPGKVTDVVMTSPQRRTAPVGEAVGTLKLKRQRTFLRHRCYGSPLLFLCRSD